MTAGVPVLAPTGRSDSPLASSTGRLIVLALGGLTIVWFVLRWHGVAPFGSDNDEYRLVAQHLFDGTGPVAGGDGTKYPLLWPVALGLAGVAGADLTVAALVLNVVSAVALVAVLAWVGWRVAGPTGAATAGVLVAASPEVAGAAVTAMPDVVSTLTVALSIALAAGRPDRRRVAWLAILVVVATALKTVGLVTAVAVALTVAVRGATRGARRLAWAPLAAAVAVVGGHAVVMAGYPPSTTGYGAVFWLVDPGDASAGRIGLLDLPARALDGLSATLQDATQTLPGGDHLPLWLAVTVVVGLVVGAWVALPEHRWIVTLSLLGHLALLVVWPFSSARLALPLLPGLAVAAAGITGWAWRRGRSVGPATQRVLVAVAVLVVAAAVGVTAGDVAGRAEAEAAAIVPIRADLVAALAQLEAEAAAAGEEVVVASLDHREVDQRSDLPVVGVPYTSDLDEVLAVARERGATHLLVLRDLYGRRDTITRRWYQQTDGRLPLTVETGSVRIHSLP